MIKVVKEKIDNNNIYIGTHNGIFHCDELVAVAILQILTKKDGELYVIRSRDIGFLEKNVDLLVDIGGGEYDHHQKGGNGKRDNGVMYASAGLIWKDYGKKIIDNISNGSLKLKEIISIFNEIDKNIIQSVDMVDNGQFTTNHQFPFIRSFLPKWNSNEDYDEKFQECVNVLYQILDNTFESYVSLYFARKEIINRNDDKNTHINNILILPNQTIPWTSEVIYYNDHSNSKIDFVVFPYPNGGYALQCVPESKENIFSRRIPLPEEWAGERERLPEISGFKSANFCHNGRFFARADDYNDIIEMCNAATKIYKEQKIKSLKR